MKLRQARKILRRGRPVRYCTAMAALLRLEQRAFRWRKQHHPIEPNPRPSYNLWDLVCALPSDIFDRKYGRP